MKQRKFQLVLFVCSVFPFAAVFSIAQTKKPARYEEDRVSMACTYSIVVYGTNPEALSRIVNTAFDEIDRIDRLMSHYKRESSLSRLNREAANHPVKVEPELFDFIAECLRYSRESDGAFDISVGPLMKAWGFFRGEGRMPAEAELAEARSRVGYHHIILNHQEKTIRFDREGVELDLGGIAKGYAVDRAVAVLKQHNIERALVNACGSTIYGLGTPPQNSAWTLKLQDPIDRRNVARVVRLKNQALSVSGSYEKFFEIDGVRYSHIMDPRIGKPVQGILSVAVVTSDGVTGDALDNIFFVQGVRWSRDQSKRFPGTEAIFFLPDPKKGWKAVRLPGGSMRNRPINHRVNSHPRN